MSITTHKKTASADRTARGDLAPKPRVKADSMTPAFLSQGCVVRSMPCQLKAIYAPSVEGEALTGNARASVDADCQAMKMRFDGRCNAVRRSKLMGERGRTPAKMRPCIDIHQSSITRSP